MNQKNQELMEFRDNNYMNVLSEEHGGYCGLRANNWSRDQDFLWQKNLEVGGQ